MRFTCNRDDLIDGVNIVQKAIPSKSNLAVLEGILLEVGEELKMTGNDNDMCIIYEVPAIIEEIGDLVVPSKTFGDIIRRLPDVYVTVETSDDGNTINITSGKSKYNIKTMISDIYPKPSLIESSYDISMTEKDLVSMIKQSIIATSPDDKRIILRGIYIEEKESHMNFVALDGFRLAVKTMLREGTTEFTAIVPSKAMSELMKILKGDDSAVNIRSNGSQIMFYNEHLNIISKLYKGEYINYRKMIPPEFVTKVIINNKLFLAAIERASLIMNDEKKYSLNIELSDMDEIILSAVTDSGSCNEVLAAEIIGKPMILSFNPRSIIDCLKIINNEMIEMSFTSDVGPCVIKGDNDDSFLYVLMPVKMTK